eukprot:1194825-Prorocentrum_minimum.AAC.4
MALGRASTPVPTMARYVFMNACMEVAPASLLAHAESEASSSSGCASSSSARSSSQRCGSVRRPNREEGLPSRPPKSCSSRLLVAMSVGFTDDGERKRPLRALGYRSGAYIETRETEVGVLAPAYRSGDFGLPEDANHGQARTYKQSFRRQ